MDDAAPLTVAALVKRWNAAIAKGDLVEAKVVAGEGVAAFPDNARLRYHLAWTEHRTGSASEAVRHCVRAVQLDGKDTVPRLFLSALLMQHGLLEAARSHAVAALETSPDQVGIHLRLSEIALRAGEVQGAHHWADRAIAGSPQNPACYLCRANAHLQIAEYDYAEAALRTAARLDPSNAAVAGKLALLEAIRDIPPASARA